MPSSTARPPGRAARAPIRETPESQPTPAPDPAEPAGGLGVQPRSTRPAAAYRRGERRILLVGLALSVALHLILLLVSRFVAFDTADGGHLPAPPPVSQPGEMEIVAIRPVADAGEPAPSPARATAPAETIRPPSVDPRPATPPADGAVATPPAARDRFSETLEALRPRLLDPRLRPGSVDALRTDEERAALRAYARINALNDSILAQMERERRATDWTYTDADGRRWGVSPGKLHLGGIEIPLPLTFSPTPEQRERILEWHEIQAQAEQGLIDETFDERVEAIRNQREADDGE